jgi:hypothetical protein
MTAEKNKSFRSEVTMRLTFVYYDTIKARTLDEAERMAVNNAKEFAKGSETRGSVMKIVGAPVVTERK